MAMLSDRKHGGQGRNRTADASLFRAALYQLSYLAGDESFRSSLNFITRRFSHAIASYLRATRPNLRRPPPEHRQCQADRD